MFRRKQVGDSDPGDFTTVEDHELQAITLGEKDEGRHGLVFFNAQAGASPNVERESRVE